MDLASPTIDFVTYFFAIFALLIVRIPQPQAEPSPRQHASQVLNDINFGLNYLRERPGLLGLLAYYATVNFFLSITFVLTTPMILSRHSASVLGVIQMIMGMGALAGGLAASAWGGPKTRRVQVVIGGIMLYTVGIIIAGLRVNPAFPAVGITINVFLLSIVQSISNAIWQSKVAPEAQGRVFSLRFMLATIITPLAYLTAGPLADWVFEPLMRQGGALANTWVGIILETGSGRGIGLMWVLAGGIIVATSLLAYLNPRIRRLEQEVPDAIAE